MDEGEKVVCRFNNGRTLKCYLKAFSPGQPEVTVEDAADGSISSLPVRDLKALFFVRTFGGDRSYHEKKIYGTSRGKGHRVFIKFRDGESLVGFLEGDIPWKKGFFLSRKESDLQGFFLMPADGESNNLKVFVVAASVNDLTVVP